MQIKTPQELEQLVKLCRKLGVDSIEVDGIKLALKEQPKRHRKNKSYEEIVTPDELTPDQLLMWSAEPRDVD